MEVENWSSLLSIASTISDLNNWKFDWRAAIPSSTALLATVLASLPQSSWMSLGVSVACSTFFLGLFGILSGYFELDVKIKYYLIFKIKYYLILLYISMENYGAAFARILLSHGASRKSDQYRF